MKRTWTIIGVRNVPASVRWYQSLLGLPQSSPAHDYFGQVSDTDGSRLEEEPQVNPGTRTPEFSVRDPDGYYVTISAVSGDPLRGG